MAKTKKKKVIKKKPTPKTKVKKVKKEHPEIKGMFLLSFCILSIISVVSFYQQDPMKNWLGNLGYSLGWIFNYIFGFGSYLVLSLLTWIGWRKLCNKKIENFSTKIVTFSILLISFCFISNVIADEYISKLVFLEKKVFTETILINFPTFNSHVRYNLGGVPFYYIFKELPYFNLQDILSNLGVSIIFSITGVISFVLLTEIKILKNLKTFFINIGKAFRAIFLFFIKIFKKIFHLLNKFEEFLFETPKKKKIIKPQIIKPTIIKKPVFKIPVLKKEKKSLRDTLFKKIKPTLNQSSKNYSLPLSSLLTSAPQIDKPALEKELKKQSLILQETLESFGIKAKVGNIHAGPTITSFEVHPSTGVKVQKIKSLERDIALNMQSKSIRIIAPIPGKAAVGVEIPSLYPQDVSLKEMLEHYIVSHRKMSLPILLGKSVCGDHIISDLTKMPHLLIAGATGSGKSVCINSIVMSIIMTKTPDEIKLLLIDPKKVELTQYSNLPHMLAPVITEPHGAYSALQWLVKEMKKRYDILKALALRNFTSFNSRKINKKYEEALEIEIPEKMPLIVAIIDEFADLMMVSSTDLETPIARIAQMARAVGIHLILATQRPSREVITGIIKANFPCRIAFKVSSRVNSQIILDEIGAESLLGNGDLLFLPPGTSQLIRAQGAYISDSDILRTIDAICLKAPTNYLIKSFDKMKDFMPQDKEDKKSDPLYDQALITILESRNASTTFLQRKLKVGYARAASLMDEL